MRGRIRRGVRVRRVVRRLELWSVFKIGLLFHLISGIMSVAVGIGLWTLASQAGLIEKLASFLGDLLGTTNFQIDGALIFRAALPIVGALVVVNVVATLVLAFVYNMLSGIFGGLVLSVLQEIPKPGTVAAQVALANGSTPQLVPATRQDRKAAEAKARRDETEARQGTRKAQASTRNRVKGARAVKVSEPGHSLTKSLAKQAAANEAPSWVRPGNDSLIAPATASGPATVSAPATVTGSVAESSTLLSSTNGTDQRSGSDPTGSWMTTPGSGLSQYGNQ